MTGKDRKKCFEICISNNNMDFVLYFPDALEISEITSPVNYGTQLVIRIYQFILVLKHY
jgi:hypothetical protein